MTSYYTNIRSDKLITVSDEMLELCQKEKGTLMTQIKWYKLVSNYIKDNNLLDEVKCRNINPDEKLKKLLKLTETSELTVFNLLKTVCKSGHFIDNDYNKYEEPERYKQRIYVIYHKELQNITIF